MILRIVAAGGGLRGRRPFFWASLACCALLSCRSGGGASDGGTGGAQAARPVAVQNPALPAKAQSGPAPRHSEVLPVRVAKGEQEPAPALAGHHMAEEGTIRGAVTKLHLGSGRVVVRSGKKYLSVHAVPDELADLLPGQVVALPYARYGRKRWVPHGRRELDGRHFARNGEARGAVDALDKGLGYLEVQGLLVRCHPEALTGIYPGSFVRLSWARIGREVWLRGPIRIIPPKPRDAKAAR